MNKVILIGRVGKTPETSVFDNGKKVTKFSLATNEFFGKDNKETMWHNISVWDNYGETMGKLIKIGSQIGVEGRILYSPYERDGVKCIYTNINADKIELLDKKSNDYGDSESEDATPKQTKQNSPSVTNQPEPQNFQSNSSSSEDDLPF